MFQQLVQLCAEAEWRAGCHGDGDAKLPAHTTMLQQLEKGTPLRHLNKNVQRMYSTQTYIQECIQCINPFSANRDKSRTNLNHYNDTRIKFLMKRPFQWIPTCLVSNQRFQKKSPGQQLSSERYGCNAPKACRGKLLTWTIFLNLGMLGFIWKVFSWGIWFWYHYNDSD